MSPAQLTAWLSEYREKFTVLGLSFENVSGFVDSVYPTALLLYHLKPLWRFVVRLGQLNCLGDKVPRPHCDPYAEEVFPTRSIHAAKRGRIRLAPLE